MSLSELGYEIAPFTKYELQVGETKMFFICPTVPQGDPKLILNITFYQQASRKSLQ